MGDWKRKSEQTVGGRAFSPPLTTEEILRAARRLDSRPPVHRSRRRLQEDAVTPVVEKEPSSGAPPDQDGVFQYAKIAIPLALITVGALIRATSDTEILEYAILTLFLGALADSSLDVREWFKDGDHSIFSGGYFVPGCMVCGDYLFFRLIGMCLLLGALASSIVGNLLSWLGQFAFVQPP